MLASDSINTRKPAMMVAGKPTEKMFRLGAARVTTPRPMLMNSSVTMTGKAVSKAPRKIIELQLTSCA